MVAHGLGMSINGQDPRSNVYLLDGTPLNDFTNGPAGSAAGTALGTETIREFRVEANAYGAEFGRNSGGQIHAVTKSGTNQRHGSGYLYHRNDALDARNYFDAGEKPDFTRYQFGATFGGPIRQDRTFFFVGVEGLRERLGRTVSTVVPDDDARRGVLPGVGAIGVDPAVRAVPGRVSRSPTAPTSAAGWRPTTSCSTRPSTSTSSRRGWTRTSAPRTSSSCATPSTTPTSTCPRTSRSSRGTSSPRTSS